MLENMLRESWNVVYIVEFPKEDYLNDEFSSREEAINYANEHLDKNPIVRGKEIYLDDNGATVSEGEEEIIIDTGSDSTIVGTDESELDSRLNNLIDSEISDAAKVEMPEENTCCDCCDCKKCDCEKCDCKNCNCCEEDEMSDQEFAEAFKKGLEEKHCKNCSKQIAEDHEPKKTTTPEEEDLLNKNVKEIYDLLQDGKVTKEEILKILEKK